jgi:hypothetical protein
VNQHSTELTTEREVALVEILDRALGAGVVITGDVTLSLADIDLVYLDLRLIVGSVGTIFGQEEPEVLRLGGDGNVDGRPR